MTQASPKWEQMVSPDTLGTVQAVGKPQGMWESGAEPTGRNGEPAPRVRWTSREAPPWCGFISMNLLTLWKTSPPHELQASILIAAFCPGMGASPSMTALLLAAPSDVRVLEGRNCSVHLCVLCCLAHCSQ